MKKILLKTLLLWSFAFLLLFSRSFECQYIYNQHALNMINYTKNYTSGIQRLSIVKVAMIDEGITSESLINFVMLHKDEANEKSSHGTMLADLLGSCYDPNTGYQGLIPGMPLYGYSLSINEMNTASLIEAIKYVISWNVDIISISMGTNKENNDLQNAILNAVRSGIVVICSAGNNPYDVNYPASYQIPGVISVGAIGNDYNILPYTNTNSQVDIYAPGENIVSLTDNNTKVMTYSGTSVAVPFVTLACIYIKAFSPSLNPAKVENFLINHTDTNLAKWRNGQREIRVLNMEQLIKSLNIKY